MAQSPRNQQTSKPDSHDEPTTELDETQVMIHKGITSILEMQEGPDHAEWPYEGVYRVDRNIPIGYRVGGTGICALALIQAPGYEMDDNRQQAVSRAIRFIVNSINHDLMAHEFQSGYDVRGWGYAYGLLFLTKLKALELIPDGLNTDVEKASRFFITGIAVTEIPERGGWNYARRGGFQKPGASSPFMTGSTLQALFQAVAVGFEVDRAMVERGVKALQRGMTTSGAIAYSGTPNKRSGRDTVPGSTGRMLVACNTLFLAGQATQSEVRGSVDAFIVHWDWLEKRRRQPGTHAPPYGIAPYYFYYAHYYAAQAVELLPPNERPEYRRRIQELLLRTRSNEGTWNDRVFERSANYGTAMSIMAIMMPDLPEPTGWRDRLGDDEIVETTETLRGK